MQRKGCIEEMVDQVRNERGREGAGVADKFIQADEIAAFRKNLDTVGAVYSFKAYDGALHAFSNPAATEIGKKFKMDIAYNAAADTASWNDMKAFFKQYFY